MGEVKYSLQSYPSVEVYISKEFSVVAYIKVEWSVHTMGCIQYEQLSVSRSGSSLNCALAPTFTHVTTVLQIVGIASDFITLAEHKHYPSCFALKLTISFMKSMPLGRKVFIIYNKFQSVLKLQFIIFPATNERNEVE